MEDLLARCGQQLDRDRPVDPRDPAADRAGRAELDISARGRLAGDGLDVGPRVGRRVAADALVGEHGKELEVLGPEAHPIRTGRQAGDLERRGARPRLHQIPPRRPPLAAVVAIGQDLDRALGADRVTADQALEPSAGIELRVDPFDNAVRSRAVDRGRARERRRLVPALERELSPVRGVKANVVDTRVVDPQLVAAVVVEIPPRARYPSTGLVPIDPGVAVGHRSAGGVGDMAADSPARQEADRHPSNDRAGTESDVVGRIERRRGAPAARQVQRERVGGIDARGRIGANPVATRGELRKVIPTVDSRSRGGKPLPVAAAGLEPVQIDPGIGKRSPVWCSEDATGDAARFIAQRRRGSGQQPNDAREDRCRSDAWSAAEEGKADQSPHGGILARGRGMERTCPRPTPARAGPGRPVRGLGGPRTWARHRVGRESTRGWARP